MSLGLNWTGLTTEAEAYCQQSAGTVILGIGPAGTHGHISVQCQDLCVFFLSVFLPIVKGGVGLLFYIDWCSPTTPYSRTYNYCPLLT
jgi:hypothetical protein